MDEMLECLSMGCQWDQKLLERTLETLSSTTNIFNKNNLLAVGEPVEGEFVGLNVAVGLPDGVYEGVDDGFFDGVMEGVSEGLAHPKENILSSFQQI